MGEPHHASPFVLDVRDADFSPQMSLWAFGAICEMNETVVRTRATIAASRALMADADRLLAGGWR